MISLEHIDEWNDDCMSMYGVTLENTKYAHWCPDWDDMPINETLDEFDGCTCCSEGPP